MQSAIVEAFKSILPADSSTAATPPPAASPSANGSMLPADVTKVDVAPTQALQGRSERPLMHAQTSVLQHNGPVSEGPLAEQGTSAPQGTSSSMLQARPQDAKIRNASSLPAPSLPCSPSGQVPVAMASPSAASGERAQAPFVQTEPAPREQASQQPQAPRDPLQNSKPLQALHHAGTVDAVELNRTEGPSRQAPTPTDSEPSMLQPSPTTAEAAEGANSDRLNAAAPAATFTSATSPSAAAEAVAAAASSSQAPLDTHGSQQGTTAPTNLPTPSHAVTPQLAPAAATLTAAAQPLPASLDQALPVASSFKPQSAVLPTPAAALTAGVAYPDPPAPTLPLRTLTDQGQAASMPLSKGLPAPPGGEGNGPSLALSAGTASGKASATASGAAPWSQGSISATAVTPPATAPPPPATAAMPPAAAAILPATAATPSATAAKPLAAAVIPLATAAAPPATALESSVPAAFRSRSVQPSAGLGTAAQGSVRGSPGVAKAHSAAPYNAAKGFLQCAAPSAVMANQSLAALTPPVVQNPLRGQAPQLAANFTTAFETSTVPALLPPALSTGAPPVGAPAFNWLSKEPSQVPQLPVDLAPSATAHAAPVAVSPGLSPTLPQTQLAAPPMPSAAAAERPFHFPANHALTPAEGTGLTPSPSSHGIADISFSPSLFSPAQAAGPAKKKSSKASKKRKAEQQAVPSSASPESRAKQPPASADKKRKAERQAIANPVPLRSDAKQSPVTAAALPSLPSCTPDSASRHPPNAVSLNPKQHHSAPNKHSFEFVSPELTAMRNAHGHCSVPMVGAHAVQSQLADVKSLATDSTFKYSLKNIINAIGEFAVGHQQRQEVFLGDLHNSRFHQQQVGLHCFLFASSFRCCFFCFFCCCCCSFYG